MHNFPEINRFKTVQKWDEREDLYLSAAKKNHFHDIFHKFEGSLHKIFHLGNFL